MANNTTARGGPLQQSQISNEQYKTIAAFPGYVFSDTGKVLSLCGLNADDLCQTQTGALQFRPGISADVYANAICRPFVYRGHLQVNLRVGGKYKCRRLDRLLAEAWIGPPPARGGVVLLDPSKPPIPSNLAWEVPQKGKRAMQLERSERRGERNALIRELHEQGVSDGAIALRLAVPSSTVSGIIGTRRPTPRSDRAEILRLWQEGFRKVEIQRRMKISETTVYRALKDCPSPRISLPGENF